MVQTFLTGFIAVFQVFCGELERNRKDWPPTKQGWAGPPRESGSHLACPYQPQSLSSNDELCCSPAGPACGLRCLTGSPMQKENYRCRVILTFYTGALEILNKRLLVSCRIRDSSWFGQSSRCTEHSICLITPDPISVMRFI